jgi:tetratricopeptide (TPR) repeat protein
MNKDIDERLNQAAALPNQGKLQEGEDALVELDYKYPEQAPILYNLGVCYSELGTPDQAEAQQLFGGEVGKA